MRDGKDVQITIVCDVHALPQFSIHCLKFSVVNFLSVLFIFLPPQSHHSSPNILNIFRIRHCGLFSIKSWNFSDYFFDFQFRVYLYHHFHAFKRAFMRSANADLPHTSPENGKILMENWKLLWKHNLFHSTFIHIYISCKTFSHPDDEFCRLFIQIISLSPPFT